MSSRPRPCERGTSHTRLQYQRPRASWLKLPDLIRPSTARCSHRRKRWPRRSTVVPSRAMSWFVNGTHPSARLGPRLARQRSFGRRAAFRFMTYWLIISCTTCDGRPSSLPLPLVRTRGGVRRRSEAPERGCGRRGRGALARRRRDARARRAHGQDGSDHPHAGGGLVPRRTHRRRRTQQGVGRLVAADGRGGAMRGPGQGTGRRSPGRRSGCSG